jgi:transcriptional antiterminator RfaH
MSLAWYVARIKTTISWDAIILNLLRQDFASYIPLVQSASYFAGKKTIVEEPLFPAYLFVELDLEKRWHAVKHTVGVTYLLPARAEIPLSVPTAFIEQLRVLRTEAKMVQVTKRFLANELVRFIAGPFAEGARATGVTRGGRVISSSERLTRVAVPALGRETVVTVPTEHLAIV